MSEVDMFLNLLDSKEIYELVKIYSPSIKIDNLELMKTKLRVVFKSGSATIKGKKKNVFIDVLKRFKREEFKLLSFEEYRILLALRYDISDSIKFANLLLYFPEEYKNIEEMMLSNIAERKYIFQSNIEIKSNEDVVNIITKIYLLDNNEFIVNNVHERFQQLSKLGLFEECSLSKYRNDKAKGNYNDFYDLKESNINKIISYITSNFNNMENLVLRNLCIHILSNYLDTLKYEFMNQKNKLSEANNEIDKLRKKLENEERKRENELKQDERDKNKAIDQFEAKLRGKDNEIECLQNQLELSSKKIINQDKLIEQLNEVTNLYKQENKIRTSIEKELLDINRKMDYAFGTSYNSYTFCVIHSMEDIFFIDKIFKEVSFIDYKKWENNVKEFREVYIQRGTIPSSKLNQITRYCTKNNIKFSLLDIGNEKELIEEIALIKNNKEMIQCMI